MKTTKKEVRTIYHIQLEKFDVMQAFDKAYEEYKRIGVESFTIIYKEAFKEIINKDEEELKNVEIRRYAETIINHLWGNKEDSDTLSYVIKFLGFDGIENYGIYKEKCDARCMTVYMEGDTL